MASIRKLGAKWQVQGRRSGAPALPRMGRRPDGIRLSLGAPRLALEPTLRIPNKSLPIFDWQDLQR